ncbi:hypothetical protein GCM10010198_21220 [Nocardia seriolae]|nr:hypothetical protein NSERKGN1266_79350 [Nocardia seriolae]BEK99790.1 hypothetical protein NSER024013_76960 [Nocardia seriolae]
MCTNNFHDGLGGLAHSTSVVRADTGAAVALKTLRHSGERPLVWSLDHTMRFIPRPITALTSGVDNLGRVSLASGRSLKISTGSRLLTVGGWKPLEELAIDTRIAIPRWIPHTLNATPMPEAEIVMLAHMIGDGSCVQRQPIRYASVDEENLAAVTTAAIGITAIRDDYAPARVTTLRLPAPFHLTHGKRNPIAAWLDGLVLQRHLCESVLVDLLCGVGSCCGRVGFVDESDRGSVRAVGAARAGPGVRVGIVGGAGAQERVDAGRTCW